MSGWARVGVKCVCVDDSNYYIDGEACPSKGKVYTIRSLIPELNAIRLVEIKNKPRHYCEGYRECGFMLYRFRPLTSTRTEAEDLAVFRPMLRVEELA